MDLYTLDSGFQRDTLIDIRSSLIWTERFYDAGDVNLVVPATSKMISLLPEGTKLSIPESKEVMVVDTLSIENGALTATGKSLVAQTDQRVYAVTSSDNPATQATFTDVQPAALITKIISDMLVTGSSVLADVGLDSINEPFANLIVQNLAAVTATISVALSPGQIFDIIQPIAQAASVGITMQLQSADDSGYILLFKTYTGIDRTSDQDLYDVVRFSPKDKNLSGTSELYSNANYKNVCYVYISSLPATISISDVDTPLTGVRLGKASLSTSDLASIDFDRRVIMVDASDFNIDNFDQSSVEACATAINAYLDAYAMNTLLNNTYTRTVDGEVVPQSKFRYGQHYFLGDIIELQGTSGITQRALVTEYIRAQDNTGERAYPTIVGVD